MTYGVELTMGGAPVLNDLPTDNASAGGIALSIYSYYNS